jgi:hypothetical protein
MLALIVLVSGAIVAAQERSKGSPSTASEKKTQSELQKSNDESKKGSPTADVEKPGGKPKMSIPPFRPTFPDIEKNKPKGSTSDEKPAPITVNEEGLDGPSTGKSPKKRSSDQRQAKEEKPGDGKSQPAKKN